MRRRTKQALLMGIIGLGLVGCTGTQPGMVSVTTIGPLINDVSDRHDNYVNADATLVPAEKSTALRSTELLRRIVAEASATPVVVPPSE